jgi:hypothetical protein
LHDPALLLADLSLTKPSLSLAPPGARVQPWCQYLLRHASNNASLGEQAKAYVRLLFRIRFPDSTASYLRIWECANAPISPEVSSQSKGAKENDNNKKNLKVQKEKKKKGEGKGNPYKALSHVKSHSSFPGPAR